MSTTAPGSAADAGIARAALERLLETDGAALRASLRPDFADRVEDYVRLLLDANQRLNLTRVTEPDTIARLHLLDALAALALVDAAAPKSAVDIGSGGGVPGIVLALARPEVRWLLVDSVAKKADALRSFVAELGMSNVAVSSARAEELGRDPAHRERHDLVTARAVAALPVLIEYAIPLLRVAGTLVAWKGALTEADPEIAAGRTALDALGGGELRRVDPGLRALADHCLVVVEKGAPTPDAYPRRPGVAARRPLG